MGDIEDTTAQLEVAKAAAEARARAAENEALFLRADVSDLKDRMEKADAAIELLANTINSLIGKDGIKVELPIITIDPAVLAAIRSKGIGSTVMIALNVNGLPGRATLGPGPITLIDD